MLRAVARWCRTPAGVVVTSVLATLVYAFLVNLTLDLWHVSGNNAPLAGHALTDELPMFLLGTWVVWLFVILLVAVLGRLWVSIGLVAAATVALGFANHRKREMVMEPLYPSDLAFVANAGFLADMVGWGVALIVVPAMVVLVGATALAGRRISRWFPRPVRPGRPRLTWAVIGVRAVGAVTSIAAIAYVLQFHHPGNMVKAAYDDYGAHWRPVHQGANYADNGFVAGMLFNLPVRAMATPAGYDRTTMATVASRYSAVADRINKGRDPSALDDVNVVLVLSESFSDPTQVDSVELAEDPIPYTRSLMERTTAGTMWSHGYGAGTANVEFEALTGLSLTQFRPQVTTPYQMLVPGRTTFPSAAHLLGQRGLETLAMHSFTSALYRRAEVYPILGFDDQVFRDQMSHTETLDDNQFISDASTFDEVLGRLEGSRPPMFLNVVTMQNHFPMAGKYDDPIPSTGMSDPTATDNLEHYARGLRHSDNAMRDFIGALEASDEKTVVAFYGDHLPAVWTPSVLTNRTKHQTPFFVYSNFGQAGSERLPTTSPVYFMNHVLDVADAPVTPYRALLQRLEEEIPAMAKGGVMLGPNGRRLSHDDLSPRAKQLLRDYRLVQYDLTIGRKHSMDAMFSPAHHPGQH